MSQEKVERYKEAKANRKKTMKKEKRMHILRNSVASLVVIVVVGWIVGSGVTSIIESQPREAVEVDYAAVSNYEGELTAVETAK